MKAILCHRHIQFGVHATEVTNDDIFYIPEMNVILYKSKENWKNDEYGVCLTQELLDEIKKHVEKTEISDYVSDFEEIDLNIDKSTVEGMILAKQHLEKPRKILEIL